MTDSDRVVEMTLRISARPETVWRYWTDPDRMCDWWGAAAELDPTPGGACVVELGGGGVMRGTYVELVPHERIVFTVGWDPTDGAPDIPPGSSVVEIILTPDGDDTVVALRHSGLPPAAAADHRSGWGHFLPLLAALPANPASQPERTLTPCRSPSPPTTPSAPVHAARARRARRGYKADVRQPRGVREPRSTSTGPSRPSAPTPPTPPTLPSGTPTSSRPTGGPNHRCEWVRWWRSPPGSSAVA